MSYTYPLRNPPAGKTPHGVRMSPRMSRVYSWVNANGVYLTPFSTDDGVESNYSRLLSLRMKGPLTVRKVRAFRRILAKREKRWG